MQKNLESAVALGFGQENASALIKALEKEAGVEVKATSRGLKISASIKIAAQHKLRFQVKRALILGAIVAGIATLIFGCERSAERAGPKGSSNPEADPLAQPKSLQQVGVPVNLTQEAIPADNPQTPEKIALGQKLFFERPSVGRRVPSLAATCHDPARRLHRQKTHLGRRKRSRWPTQCADHSQRPV